MKKSEEHCRRQGIEGYHNRDGAPQAEVYKMLRTVLEERSEAKLSDLLGRALHILQSDAQKAAFQEY